MLDQLQKEDFQRYSPFFYTIRFLYYSRGTRSIKEDVQNMLRKTNDVGGGLILILLHFTLLGRFSASALRLVAGGCKIVSRRRVLEEPLIFDLKQSLKFQPCHRLQTQSKEG